MSLKEIPGASPWFGNSLEPLLEDIKEILLSGELVKGKHLIKFEKSAAEMAGTVFAASVSSGGTALELALEALEIAGKEVILPSQTFIASANAIQRAGGIPVFAEIDKDTLCLDPESVLKQINSDTAGVMFVHMFGLVPPSILEIRKICNNNGLFLIEDAAHAHGASINGQLAGGIGDVGCFSFFATKVVTTGEGGVVTTNRKDIYDRVLSLRDHGRTPDGLFKIPGNNFRLPEIQCAIGWRQMEMLGEIIEHRNLIARIYIQGLEANPFLNSLPEQKGAHHAYWRYATYLDDRIDRQEFQNSMWENHRIRITWMYEPLCHQQPVSTDKGNIVNLPVSEWTIARLINLPTHMLVSEEDAHRVVSAIISETEKLA